LFVNCFLAFYFYIFFTFWFLLLFSSENTRKSAWQTLPMIGPTTASHSRTCFRQPLPYLMRINRTKAQHCPWFPLWVAAASLRFSVLCYRNTCAFLLFLYCILPNRRVYFINQYQKPIDLFSFSSKNNHWLGRSIDCDACYIFCFFAVFFAKNAVFPTRLRTAKAASEPVANQSSQKKKAEHAQPRKTAVRGERHSPGKPPQTWHEKRPTGNSGWPDNTKVPSTERCHHFIYWVNV